MSYLHIYVLYIYIYIYNVGECSSAIILSTFFLDRYIHCSNITSTNHIWMFTGNCRIYFNLYHFTFLFIIGLPRPVRCVLYVKLIAGPCL